jgi:hypothetical protein
MTSISCSAAMKIEGLAGPGLMPLSLERRGTPTETGHPNGRVSDPEGASWASAPGSGVEAWVTLGPSAEVTHDS